MVDFFETNYNDIIKTLMNNYEENLINAGYHHKIYYYPLQNQDVDVDAKEIDFYMFDFEKYFKFVEKGVIV